MLCFTEKISFVHFVEYWRRSWSVDNASGTGGNKYSKQVRSPSSANLDSYEVE